MDLNLVSCKKPLKDSKQGDGMTGTFLEHYCNNRTDNTGRIKTIGELALELVAPGCKHRTLCTKEKEVKKRAERSFKVSCE